MQYSLGFLFAGPVAVQHLSPHAHHGIGLRLIERAGVRQRVVVRVQVADFVRFRLVGQILSLVQIVHRVEPEAVHAATQPVQQRVLRTISKKKEKKVFKHHNIVHKVRPQVELTLISSPTDGFL